MVRAAARADSIMVRAEPLVAVGRPGLSGARTSSSSPPANSWKDGVYSTSRVSTSALTRRLEKRRHVAVGERSAPEVGHHGLLAGSGGQLGLNPFALREIPEGRHDLTLADLNPGPYRNPVAVTVQVSVSN